LKTLGITILIVEHKFEKLVEYVDKIALLHEGKLLGYDTAEHIFSTSEIETYGVGQPIYTALCKRMGLKKANGYYPVSFGETVALLNGLKDQGWTGERTMVDAIIKVDGLWFAYKEDEYVLQNIDIQFDDKPTAIVGQNGAGKTTFVKVLKGLLKPSKGDVWIAGTNTKETTVAQLSKIIGLVFQNPSDQMFKSKVIDEVMFGPLNIWKDKKDRNYAYEQSIKALKIVELDNKIEEHPYDLTLSERKLLCLASIIAMDPKIIILDEPTIAQDRFSTRKLAKIIKELVRDGKVVLTITHDMDFVAENFERTVIFYQGQVLDDGPTEKVLSNEENVVTAHLELPNLVKLAKALDFKTTPLTIDDFVDELSTYKKAED